MRPPIANIAITCFLSLFILAGSLPTNVFKLISGFESIELAETESNNDPEEKEENQENKIYQGSGYYAYTPPTLTRIFINDSVGKSVFPEIHSPPPEFRG